VIVLGLAPFRQCQRTLAFSDTLARALSLGKWASLTAGSRSPLASRGSAGPDRIPFGENIVATTLVTPPAAACTDRGHHNAQALNMNEVIAKRLGISAGT
jgi:hypothetical protein